MDARHCRAVAKYGAQQAKSPQPGGGESLMERVRPECERVKGLAGGGGAPGSLSPKTARAFAWPELLVGQLSHPSTTAIFYHQRRHSHTRSLIFKIGCNTHLHASAAAAMLHMLCEQPRRRPKRIVRRQPCSHQYALLARLGLLVLGSAWSPWSACPDCLAYTKNCHACESKAFCSH